MNKRKRPAGTDLEDRALFAVLAAFLVISIGDSVLNLDPKWQLPLVFAALIAVMRMLAPVSGIQDDMQYLRKMSASPKMNLFPSMDGFYFHLCHALTEATSTLDLTHIRDNHPDDFGLRSSGWFDEVMRWAAKSPNRSARRIICIRNQAMLEWAKQLNEVCRETPQFRVRVVNWSIAAPAINMAIVITAWSI